MSNSFSQFYDELDHLMPLLMKEFIRRQTNEIFEGKVTLPQLLILNFLDQNQTARMSDLAKFMQVTTAAMTGIIERLVKAGYVLRVYDLKDRRIINVKITSKGSALLKRINQKRQIMLKEVFGRLSEKERQDYLNVLRHIYAILTEKKRSL